MLMLKDTKFNVLDGWNYLKIIKFVEYLVQQTITIIIFENNYFWHLQSRLFLECNNIMLLNANINCRK